jgi:hypothetical protein
MNESSIDWYPIKKDYIEGDKTHPNGYTVKQLSVKYDISNHRIYKRIRTHNWKKDKEDFKNVVVVDGVEISNDDVDDSAIEKTINVYTQMLSVSEKLLQDAIDLEDVELRLRVIQVLGGTNGMSKLLKDIKTLIRAKQDRRMKNEIEIPDDVSSLSLEDLKLLIGDK